MKCVGLSLRTPQSPCKNDAKWMLADPVDEQWVGSTCDQHIATLLNDAGWDRTMLITPIEDDEDGE